MNYYDEIKKICKNNDGIITASTIAENNVPSVYLTKMVNNGSLIRIERGIYMSEGGDYDEYYFFQKRNTRCIYSFLSALYLHNMTERIPFQKEVTVYKGYNSSHIHDDVIVHHVKKEIYEMGIVEGKTVFGNIVKVYDKERTICDLIAKRKSIDVEIFSKAIKTYMQNPERDLNKLRAYAKIMKINEKVDDILDIL